jgi:hypothetical protein
MGVASRIETGPHNQSRADVKSRKGKYLTSDGVSKPCQISQFVREGYVLYLAFSWTKRGYQNTKSDDENKICHGIKTSPKFSTKAITSTAQS